MSPVVLPKELPTISKSISRPEAFSMISGWPESIFRFVATPSPTFSTSRPSLNGVSATTFSGT